MGLLVLNEKEDEEEEEEAEDDYPDGSSVGSDVEIEEEMHACFRTYARSYGGVSLMGGKAVMEFLEDADLYISASNITKADIMAIYYKTLELQKLMCSAKDGLHNQKGLSFEYFRL